MGRKRHTPEQVITALREAEVGLARGKSVKLISRELGITEQTYYRWRLQCLVYLRKRALGLDWTFSSHTRHAVGNVPVAGRAALGWVGPARDDAGLREIPEGIVERGARDNLVAGIVDLPGMDRAVGRSPRPRCEPTAGRSALRRRDA